MPKEKDTSWSSGHKYSRKELLEVSSRLAAIDAFQDPIKTLEHKIAKKEWFEGVMMAATLLESIGMARLKAHLKGKISWKKIERLSFEARARDTNYETHKLISKHPSALLLLQLLVQ